MNRITQPAGETDAFFATPVEMPGGFKKAVGVVQVAMGNLGFLHRKIYNVLLANAYEGLGKNRAQFTIPVATLAEFAGFNSRDYQLVYDHCRELMQTEVQTLDFDTKAHDGKTRRKRGATTLIADFDVIEGGTIQYGFSRKMAELLYEPEKFIWMTLSAQNRFDSKYELNLFENCLRYFGTGSTGFKDVSEWRDLLGATEPTYDEFKRLNSLVLKPAAKGVNSKSGILVDPQFERIKRKVARIKFTVRANPQQSLLDHKEHARIRGTAAYQTAVAMGVEEVVVIHHIETHGEQYVAEVIDYVKAKKPKNRAAYLAHALRAGYGVKTPEERQRLAQAAIKASEARASRTAAAKQEAERKALEAEFRAHRQARTQAILASKSDRERASVVAETLQRLSGPVMRSHADAWKKLDCDPARIGELGIAARAVIGGKLAEVVLSQWGEPGDVDIEVFGGSEAG